MFIFSGLQVLTGKTYPFVALLNFEHKVDKWPWKSKQKVNEKLELQWTFLSSPPPKIWFFISLSLKACGSDLSCVGKDHSFDL